MTNNVKPPKGFYPGLSHASAKVVPLEPRPRPRIPHSATIRMKELLARPDAAQLVRTTPTQDLFFLVKQVGIQDSLELLELAHPEQIQGMVDLDVWRKDRVEVESYSEWFIATLEAKPEKLEAILDGMDPELLVLFLQQRIRTYPIDPEDPEARAKALENENVVETVGQDYLIEFLPEDPLQDWILKLITDLYGLGARNAHWLMESIRWELPSQLEETAYRLRSGRIEEMGFHDFYEALTLYHELPEGAPWRRESPPRRVSGPLKDMPHTLRIFKFGEQTLLNQVLDRLNQEEPEEDLIRDFLRLANKVIAANQLDPAQLETLEEAASEVRAHVNLGLELQSGGDLELAVELLRENAHIEWLFRRGYSEVVKLRNLAMRIEKILPAHFRKISSLPLDSPYREVLEGLLAYRGRFFLGLEDASSADHVCFSVPAQLERSGAHLARIETLLHFAFDFLAPGPADGKRLRKSLETMQLELTPSGILMTSFAQKTLGGAFAPDPLNEEQLKAFLKLAFVSYEDSAKEKLRPIREEFADQVLEAARAFRNQAGPDEGVVAEQFCHEMLEALKQSCGALDPEDVIYLRYVGGPLYLLPE